MDSSTPGDPGYSPSGQADLSWTPDISRAVDQWQTTGAFPFPDLPIYPQPQWHLLDRMDLRLIYHVSSVCSEMLQSRTSKLTIWTEVLPRFVVYESGSWGLADMHLPDFWDWPLRIHS